MWTMKVFCPFATNQGCAASIFLKRAVATRRDPTARQLSEAVVEIELREDCRALVTSSLHALRLGSIQSGRADCIAAREHAVSNGERGHARAGKRRRPYGYHRRRYR